MPDDNIHFLRPKGDPLKPMTSQEWGLELIKTYLISCKDVHVDHADGRVAKYTDAELDFVAGVAMRSIETAVTMIESGEFNAAVNKTTDDP